MALSFLGNIGNAIGSFGGSLGKILGYVNDAQKIIDPIQQIIQAVRGPDQTAQPYYDSRAAYGDFILNRATNRPMSEAERYALSMQKALAEPNNSLVNQLQGEEYQLLMNAINDGIQQKVLSDRREASMGRRPTYFDPERADENISYQLQRGAPAALLQARSNALSRIQGAAKGVGSFANIQDDRFNKEQSAYETDYLGRYLNQNTSGGGYQTPRAPVNNTVNKITGVASGLEQLAKAMTQYRRTPDFNPNAYGPYLPPNMTSLPNGEIIRWNQMRYR